MKKAKHTLFHVGLVVASTGLFNPAAHAGQELPQNQRAVIVDTSTLPHWGIRLPKASIEFNRDAAVSEASVAYNLPEMGPPKLPQSGQARAKELVGSVRSLVEFSIPLSSINAVAHVNLRKKKISTDFSRNWKLDLNNIGENNQNMAIQYSMRF